MGIHDRRLARIVTRCGAFPGQELFQYLDNEGEPRPIESSDVNAYLQDAAGIPITAKDFRTWTGTLGNTPVVSRQSYIAPLVVEGYLAGSLPPGRGRRGDPEQQEFRTIGRREEIALVRFLEREGSTG